jgi:hypothetical protein
MLMLPEVHTTLLVVGRTLLRLPLVAHGGLISVIGLLLVLVLRLIVILISMRTVVLHVVSMFVEYLLLLRGWCAGLRPPTICAKSSKAYNENTLRQD